MFRAILYLRDVFSWAVLAGFHLGLESLPAANSHPDAVASWDGQAAAADGSLLVPDPRNTPAPLQSSSDPCLRLLAPIGTAILVALVAVTPDSSALGTQTKNGVCQSPLFAVC